MKLEELSLTLQTSISGGKGHSLLSRDNRVGAQMEIHTPVKRGYHYADPDKFGKATRTFYLDGDDKAYKTVAEFKKVLELITIPDTGEEGNNG